ncbi:ATP-binding protein [Tetragenococcus halophilus]|uniref:AAA family ATPase n=1 Tax=Tetragenococcus halophilus TaxID=51669 RepID=UPI002A9E542A|nr:ATP-binding protein [Tetragenococcus halophilus]
MKKTPLNYLPDLVNAHFTNDNNSFESALLSLIRLLAKDNTTKSLSEKLSKQLSQHQAGLFSDYNITRSTQSINIEKAENDFLTQVFSDKRLNELILNQPTKTKIEDIITSYNNRQKLEEAGLNYIQKIILNGEPGTGKTSVAISVARELELEAYIVKVPYLFSSYLGDSGKAIMNLFNTLKNTKAVIIFDEFDSIAVNRTTGNEIGEMRRIVNTVLTNLDIWDSESILFATTNDWKSLDSAVWRRFDEKINIDLPNNKSRKRLWDFYTKQSLFREELNIISEISRGYSPAEIEIHSQQALRMKVLKDENIFLSIIKQTDLSIQNRTLKKQLTNFIKLKFPNLTTREIGSLVNASKSSVQRYLIEGEG